MDMLVVNTVAINTAYLPVASSIDFSAAKVEQTRRDKAHKRPMKIKALDFIFS